MVFSKEVQFFFVCYVDFPHFYQVYLAATKIRLIALFTFDLYI